MAARAEPPSPCTSALRFSPCLPLPELFSLSWQSPDSAQLLPFMTQQAYVLCTARNHKAVIQHGQRGRSVLYSAPRMQVARGHSHCRQPARCTSLEWCKTVCVDGMALKKRRLGVHTNPFVIPRAFCSFPIPFNLSHPFWRVYHLFTAGGTSLPPTPPLHPSSLHSQVSYHFMVDMHTWAKLAALDTMQSTYHTDSLSSTLNIVPCRSVVQGKLSDQLLQVSCLAHACDISPLEWHSTIVVV